MPRYFLTVDAARPYSVGGQAFEFEPVALRGGSWLGVLAVDEPAASILAANPPGGVDEVDQAYFDGLKKKLSANKPETPAWPTPQPPNPELTVADRAGAPTDRIIVNPPTTPGGINSTAGITAVTLLTTPNSPPNEPLLVQNDRRKKPF